MIKKKYTCPVLSFTVLICRCSAEDMASYLSIDAEDITEASCVIDLGDSSYVLWVGEFALNEYIENYLLHEFNHLCNLVFINRGIVPSPENDELESYYKQFLFTKIIKLLKRM